MKQLLTITFHLFCFAIAAQDVCSVKLIDHYSHEEISVTEVTAVNAKNAQIDTSGNLILLPKSREKNVSIHARNYYTYSFEDEFRIKEHLGDTVAIQLIPVDSIVEMRFNEIFHSDSTSIDTLDFTSENEITRQVNSYLRYLMKFTERCDNGLCNYANTYVYWFEFYPTDGIYQLTSIIKTQPNDYECLSIDDALEKLKIVFPKFRLDGEDKARMSIRVMIY